MMNKFLFLLVISLIGILSCGKSNAPVKEGKVTYAIDYPNHKDNFFLYSILPKEMELDFKDGAMHSKISKANLQNSIWVNCNKKSVAAYFSYGDEAYNVQLKDPDIDAMLNDQKKYTIEFTNVKDTMIGFNVKKAIATCVTDKKDKIELWYTTDIELKNSNWYNPFHEVPGFLLAYAIDRYGIRMEFKAKRFEELKQEDGMKPIEKGEGITYKKYNAKLNDLFESFD